MAKIRSATLKKNSGRYLVLWGAAEKDVPPEPEDRSFLTKEDPLYWHHLEYAGWNVDKINIPESPKDGAAGKKVCYIQPGRHPYMTEYRENLEKKAGEAGIELAVLESNWDDDLFDENVNRAIASKPDLILLNPENQKKSTGWYRRINEAGIPVVGGNFMPERDGFAYILAWTGPDDWGQSRLLARALAEKMNNRGNYAILRHLEGTSSYYARTWGVISELKQQAPEMRCLDFRASGIGREGVYETVIQWLDRYGEDLHAIVCADDELAMLGVVDALKEKNRFDIVSVATGSSRTGLELLRHGKVEAISYQSAAVDGSIAMETIIDWFEGVPLDPVRYLPKYIIGKEEAEDFLQVARSVDTVDLELLYRAVEELDWERAYDFFGDVYELFLNRMIVPAEMFRGFCLEVLMGLMLVLRNNNLDVTETIGSYEGLMKHLIRDDNIGRMLEWMNDLCQKIIGQISISRQRKTPIQSIMEYLDQHYNEPLSLKTLANDFSLSQVYLGQLFRKETGEKFTDYINRKRVARACEVLRGENVTASEVALSLGYSDPAYFYKIFKKYTNLSVSDFLKHHQSK